MSRLIFSRLIFSTTFVITACGSAFDDAENSSSPGTAYAAQPSPAKTSTKSPKTMATTTATTTPAATATTVAAATVATTPAAPRAAVGALASTARLATAEDLETVTSLAVDGGYVYFTGGGKLPLDPDAPPGSDTYGVLRRVPVGGGTVEELWKGQGIGYAVGRHSTGIAVITYDYATRGRTGTVRVLQAGGTTADIATWRSQGSCVGLTTRDGALFWTHSAGAGGVVNRTEGSNTTSSSAPEGACAGKPRLLGDRVFWLAESNVLQASTSTLAVTPLWTGGHRLDAIATDDDAAELVVADDDDLVAINPSTQQTRVVGAGYRGTSDLAFDTQGQVIYVANGAAGTIASVPLAGGAQTVVASGQSGPKALVATTDAIYWINDGARTVMTARP